MSDSFARPALPREHLKWRVLEAQIAAIEALAAVLRTTRPASDTLSVGVLEDRFTLACRERPEGWGDA